MLKFKIIIILLVVFNTQLLSKSILPKADKGSIDLSQWNFQINGNISLDGEWEFYWKKLISTNKLSEISQPKYFNIPNLWNDYNETEHLKSGFGFASYRLHVIHQIPQVFRRITCWLIN